MDFQFGKPNELIEKGLVVILKAAHAQPCVLSADRKIIEKQDTCRNRVDL